MSKYKIGDIYERDGAKRKVIGIYGDEIVSTTDLDYDIMSNLNGDEDNTSTIELENRITELETKQEDIINLFKQLPLDRLNIPHLKMIAEYLELKLSEEMKADEIIGAIKQIGA